MKELRKLEFMYNSEIEKNNWQENNNAKELSIKYKSLAKLHKVKCSECSSIASIDCQYH